MPSTTKAHPVIVLITVQGLLPITNRAGKLVLQRSQLFGCNIRATCCSSVKSQSRSFGEPTSSNHHCPANYGQYYKDLFAADTAVFWIYFLCHKLVLERRWCETGTSACGEPADNISFYVAPLSNHVSPIPSKTGRKHTGDILPAARLNILYCSLRKHGS